MLRSRLHVKACRIRQFSPNEWYTWLPRGNYGVYVVRSLRGCCGVCNIRPTLLEKVALHGSYGTALNECVTAWGIITDRIRHIILTLYMYNIMNTYYDEQNLISDLNQGLQRIFLTKKNESKSNL